MSAAHWRAWLPGARASCPLTGTTWYVDRCGKEVRYVIDFYFNEDRAGTPEASPLSALRWCLSA